MRIYTDFRWLGKGGIGTYLKGICSKTKMHDIHAWGKCTSFVSPVILGLCSWRYSRGVLFLPSYFPPVLSRLPFVFTIHDLNHLERDENTSLLKRLYYLLVIRVACKRASCILTVSEFSRNKIITWSNVSASKVINVSNGVDSCFSVMVKPFSPGYEYVLCVGNRKSHKNEARLVRAFNNALISSDIKLVFTGVASSDLSKLIESLNLQSRIVFLGYIPESDLPSVFRGSLGLAFPSLYEGFGLPVVEAMACGIPVLTSNTTSLPEVAGDAALLVNPESEDEIRDGIERLVTDRSLREELINKGLERAKLFSWDMVAARVQSVLNEVANRYAE